jgi:hypothetical protein
MPKILLAQPVTGPMLLQLQTLVGDKAQLEAVTSTSDEEFAQLATDADILINAFRKMDEKTLALAPGFGLFSNWELAITTLISMLSPRLASSLLIVLGLTLKP